MNLKSVKKIRLTKNYKKYDNNFRGFFMKKKFLEIYPTILFGAGGFIALSVGTILNLIYEANFPHSIIPNTNIITPIINGICALLCLVFIFSSKKNFIFANHSWHTKRL